MELLQCKAVEFIAFEMRLRIKENYNKERERKNYDNNNNNRDNSQLVQTAKGQLRWQQHLAY